MNTEQTIMAAVVVAVMALVVRIAIHRQDGKPIDWRKIISIVAVVGIFLGVFLSADPYRISLWRDGQAVADECRAGHVIGRQAGPGVFRADSLRSQGMPLFFSFIADSLSPTGYFRLRSAERVGDSVDRQLSVSDSGSVAIQRVTSRFAVTRHPSSPADYVPLWRVSLPSGQKILAEIPQYQAQPGTLPICVLRPLDDRMARIAEADSLVSRQVFALCYDDRRLPPTSVEYVLTKAAAAALAAALTLVALWLVNRFTRKVS